MSERTFNSEGWICARCWYIMITGSQFEPSAEGSRYCAICYPLIATEEESARKPASCRLHKAKSLMDG